MLSELSIVIIDRDSYGEQPPAGASYAEMLSLYEESKEGNQERSNYPLFVVISSDSIEANLDLSDEHAKPSNKLLKMGESGDCLKIMNKISSVFYKSHRSQLSKMARNTLTTAMRTAYLSQIRVFTKKRQTQGALITEP